MGVYLSHDQTPWGLRAAYLHCERCDAAGVECWISGFLLVRHFVFRDQTIGITGLRPVQEDGVRTSRACRGHICTVRLRLECEHGAPGAGDGALRVVCRDSVLVFSEWLEEIWGIDKLQGTFRPDKDQEFL